MCVTECASGCAETQANRWIRRGFRAVRRVLGRVQRGWMTSSTPCWGLFASHREEIATPHGLRTSSNYRVLWFIGWGSGPEYHAADA